LMRVGFVKYFPCKRNDLGWFQTWGINSLHFSSDLAKIMNKVVGSRIQRRKVSDQKVESQGMGKDRGQP
jgi:hypothetical protein